MAHPLLDATTGRDAPAACIHADPERAMTRPGRHDDDPLVVACTARLIADDYAADRFVDWLETRSGAPLHVLLLDTLSAAARRLGTMWLEDECSFHDVTIGTHRLTMLLIDGDHGDVGCAAAPLRGPHGGRALIAPAPDDQHGFGLGVVGLYLRRAGWDVSVELTADRDRILSRLAASEFAVAGFSVGHERAVASVTTMIADARRCSRNRAIRIAVGGPMLVEQPALADTIGADLCAMDAAELVRQLDALVPNLR